MKTYEIKPYRYVAGMLGVYERRFDPYADRNAFSERLMFGAVDEDIVAKLGGLAGENSYVGNWPGAPERSPWRTVEADGRAVAYVHVHDVDRAIKMLG